MVELIDTIDVRCTLGEGPVWDERLACLWWTDIQEQRLYRWDWNGQKAVSIDLPERLGSLGLTTNSEWLVCAFASGFALFQPKTGTLCRVAETEPHHRGIRMNDGRVDYKGNFWAGSMVEDVELAGEAMGSLYCLAPDGTVRRHLDGIKISNAISFPPSGNFLYFSDTPTGRIEKLTLVETGSPPERELFAEVDGHAGPDGAIVDSDGCLWNAEWGGSQLTCYFPDGTVRLHVALPVSQPTCAAFGGPDLDFLFITSAYEGLDDEKLATESDAGKVLILRPGSRGLAAPRFPLDRLKGVIS